MKTALPLFTAAVVLFTLSIVSSADGAVLFRDDFEGTLLDQSKWSLADWQLDRTQLGNPPVISGGMAHLRFSTFNPHHPGRSFFGTEIDSQQVFPIGSGLEFEARVRVNPLPAGLVASLFTYVDWQSNGSDYSDEMDFEFLSTQIKKLHHGGNPVQVTTYRAFNNTRPNYDDVTQASSENVFVPALDLSQFNTIVIRWLPDRVEWLVNGALIRSTKDAVPQVATRICLNFWAPSKGWGEAFSGSLMPVGNARRNHSYNYDIDYVEVRSIAPSGQ